jgi:murein L,D-transpeptidase YcbB/YkuD
MVCWLAFATASAFAQDDLIRDTLQTKVEHIRDYTPLKVGEAFIASTTLLPDIYERNHFEAIWTNPNTIAAYINQVEQIKTHGLKPSDYHAAQLRQFQSAVRYDPRNPWLLTDLELLLTDSVIRLLYHLFYGKVDPVTLYPEWNFNRELGEIDPARIILDAIRTDTVCQLVDSLKPSHATYQRLQAALVRYQAIQNQNGWPTIPAGPSMTLGTRDQRVKVLRRRLAITGDLLKTHGIDSDVFDEAVKQAVLQFQQRHVLDPDGVVDRITLDELNQPVSDWIDQIKANLERARWVLHDLPDRFVVIDICGYMAYVFKADEIEWSARIQVGKPFRQTPTFKSAIKYLVLNPTWTIPPGVLAQDILPESLKIPRYFEEYRIRVYDRNGRRIDPDAIDLKNYNTYSYKYRFVKEPGPDNPLGSVKFVFPNRHFIYLHDTIEKETFEAEWRAFSSGCIRIEDPLALAATLLNDATRWDQETLQRQVSSGSTRTVHLPEPVPIMLLYMTVYVDRKGLVYFREDVYQRDRNVIDGLDKPFAFKVRP